MKALWPLCSLLLLLFSATVWANPNREFSVDKVGGTSPLMVTFNASNIKPAKKYYWTFGTGETLTTTNSIVTYLYNKPGTFTASLKYAVNASDKDLKNLKDAGSVIINVKGVVLPPPVASLNCQTNNLLVSCNALSSFSPTGLPLNFSFDYGDGIIESNLSGLSSHAYTMPGLYSVKLIVSDSMGSQAVSLVSVQPVLPPNVLPVLKLSCSSLKPNTLECDSIGSVDSDGTIVSYQYLFDDNSSVAKADNGKVIHTFSSGGSHLVKLLATDNDGGQSLLEQSFEIKNNSLPVANFSCLSEKPYQVSCQGSATDADMPNDSIESYSWNLNNESFTGQSLAYNFQKGGEFSITLSVKDSYGGVGTSTQTISVKNNTAPVADFTCTNTGIMGIHCESKATDSDGSIANTKWSLDDGTSFETTNFNHTFSSGADHKITLAVTDNLGATNSSSQSIHLIQNQLPSFDFVSDVVTGTLPLNVRFQILNAADVDGSIVSTQINFGDNATSNLSDATHTYGAEGTYSAKATVTDNLGGVTTKTISVVVKAPVILNPPTAFFKYFQKGTYLELRAFLTKTQYDLARAYYTIDNSKTIEMTEFYQNTLNTVDVKTYGPHTIKLTVVDTTGQTGTYTHNFNLQDNPDLILPFVGFRAVQSAPRTVFVNMNQSFTPIYEEDIANYKVEFGNGVVQDISNDTFVTYTYPAAGTYTIKVTATTTHHTTASFSRTVTVTNNTVPVVMPNASFSYRIYDFAQNVTFYNERSGSHNGGIISYLWDFGDGTTGTGELAAHFYEPGSYFVKLTVTDFAGYISTQIQHLMVYGTGDSLAATMGCSQDYLKVDCWFVALDKMNQINYLNINWGDGTSSTPEIVVPEFGQYSVSHEYKVGGTFNAEGFVGTERGEIKKLPLQLSVVGQAPVANLECYTNNLLVSCNGLGSFDFNYSPLTYMFDYGDGHVETNATGISTHAYALAGSYNVKLKVTNKVGAFSVTNANVVVVAPINMPPTPILSCYSSAPYILKCNATQSSDKDGNIISYKYEWDDSTSDSYSFDTEIIHVYKTGGTHKVILTIVDNDGAISSREQDFDVLENHVPIASISCFNTGAQKISCFSYSNANDPNDSIVSYEWDLGDGSKINSFVPSIEHVFPNSATYIVSLKVTDSFGGTTMVSQEIKPFENRPPVAIMDCSNSGLQAITCNSLSYDPDGEIKSLSWSLDDGFSTTESKFTHTFSDGVDHVVTLTLIDELGGSTTSSHTYQVLINKLPSFSIAVENQSGYLPFLTQFRAVDAIDSDGTIVSYKWIFGDGATSDQPEVEHTFTSAGIYEVKLQVTDNYGGMTEKSVTIRTSSPSNLIINTDKDNGVANLNVHFDATGSTDPEGEIVKYEWFYLGKKFAEGIEADYEFEFEGIQRVDLIATNVLGVKTQAIKNISIEAPPIYIEGVASTSAFVGRVFSARFNLRLDPAISSDNVSVYLQDAPSEMNFDDAKMQISWVPKNEDIGTVSFYLNASDGVLNYRKKIQISVYDVSPLATFSLSQNEGRAFIINKPGSPLNNTQIILPLSETPYSINLFQASMDNGQVIMLAEPSVTLRRPLTVQFENTKTLTQNAMGFDHLTRSSSPSPAEIHRETNKIIVCPLQMQNFKIENGVTVDKFNTENSIGSNQIHVLKSNFVLANYKKHLANIGSIAFNMQNADIYLVDESVPVASGIYGSHPIFDEQTLYLNIEQIGDQLAGEKYTLLHEYFHIEQARAAGCTSEADFFNRPNGYKNLSEGAADYNAMFLLSDEDRSDVVENLEYSSFLFSDPKDTNALFPYDIGEAFLPKGLLFKNENIDELFSYKTRLLWDYLKINRLRFFTNYGNDFYAPPISNTKTSSDIVRLLKKSAQEEGQDLGLALLKLTDAVNNLSSPENGALTLLLKQEPFLSRWTGDSRKENSIPVSSMTTSGFEVEITLPPLSGFSRNFLIKDLISKLPFQNYNDTLAIEIPNDPDLRISARSVEVDDKGNIVPPEGFDSRRNLAFTNKGNVITSDFDLFRNSKQKIIVNLINQGDVEKKNVKLYVHFLQPNIDVQIPGTNRNPDDPFSFIYPGNTNASNNLTVTAIDLGDKDNSTTFKFQYYYFCTSCSYYEKWQVQNIENVKSISNFSIPYSTPLSMGHSVRITATNKYGKTTTRAFYVKVPKDQPPTLSLVSQECFPYCGFGCEYAIYVPYVALIKVIDPDSDVGDQTADWNTSFSYGGRVNDVSEYKYSWSGGTVILPISRCPAGGGRL